MGSKGLFPAGERSEPRSRTARRAPADRSPRRIATCAAFGVAVPRAFFGTFFRFERKYSPLGAVAPPPAPESARQSPGENSLWQSWHTPSRAGDFPRGSQSARPSLHALRWPFARTSGHIKTAAPEFLQKRRFFHFLLERLPLTPASHPQRCKKLSSLNSPGIPPPDNRSSRR